MSGTAIGIGIVEDDGNLRQSLSILLDGEPGFRVVGASPSAEQALDEWPWDSVDVLLADIDLPGMSGVDLIRMVKSTRRTVEAMAYTVYEDRATVFAAIRAGACGYLLKGASPRELVESLGELYRGGAPMSPGIARKVILELRGDADLERPSSQTLSQREVDVLRSVEDGLSYKEAAARLHISPHTVHTHIKNIYEKVHACDREEALRRARQMGAI